MEKPQPAHDDVAMPSPAPVLTLHQKPIFDDDARAELDEPRLVTVSLEQIEPSRRNPRRNLGHLDELAASLREHGLLQPIVLREIEHGRYEIVAGHRRTAAARDLGWTEISAVLRTADEDQAFLLMLIENLQRDDLSSREEAAALEVLVRERGWSTRQVAEAVKRSPAYVSKRLRVFEDPILAPLVLERKLSVTVAEELLLFPGSRRKQLAEVAAQEGWDKRQVRQALLVRGGRKKRPKPAVRRRTRDFRDFIQSLVPGELNDADRRELRLLFRDLAVLAKAPIAAEEVVVPPLEVRLTGRA